ncbi:MAG: aspartate-alanine antiporter [Puniceicoccales bacterium]|jgi:putative transport protein|nr:aspartate-alanine antiporter [Puniceicoccales bacterium]
MNTFHSAVELIKSYPEVAIFFCLAIGYLVGSIKIGKFGLGTVVGTLVTGLIVGQIGLDINPLVKTVFFTLFMFATGYKVGPQFFTGLRQGGVKMLLCTFLLCGTGLITVVLVAKLFGLDAGFASGLVSGGLTQSSVIGTATDAINHLGLPVEEAKKLAGHVAVADSITYLYGAAGVAILLSKFGPKLMGISLKEEAKKLEEELSQKDDKTPSLINYNNPISGRAFRVTEPEFVGQSVLALEHSLGSRVFVARIHRGETVFQPTPDLTLYPGDIVVISAHLNALLTIGEKIGPEVFDPQALDFNYEPRSVLVTNKRIIGKTISEISRSAEADKARGIFIRKLIRQNHPMPLHPSVVVQRGDILELVGNISSLDQVSNNIGIVDKPTEKTDFIFMGLAIVAGLLFGMLSINVGGVGITLGSSGGVLISGLIAGWLNGVRPTWGRIPPAAIWLMETIGLNTFVAVVGLSVGAVALHAIMESGIWILLAGIIVATVPHVVTILFGRHVLRMNGALLLGVCSGAGTSTPGIAAVLEEAESTLPALGYTVPYALGNVILTAWGPVVVALLAPVASHA